jgi:arginine decarboxylase
LNYNIDYLLAPKGALIEAQSLAAAAYGVDQTFFLINGSTTGNIAALMSTTRPGEKIIISRASHRSVYTGVILSGAIPVYLEPDYHPEIDYPLAVAVESVRQLLDEHPDAVAVHITSPNYYGVLSDVAGVRDLTRQRRIPLIVDEAHGSHLRFHEDLPTSAVSIGVDLIIHSTHKTQVALTQTSMLHVNDNGLINVSRVAQVLSLLQSTSPSSILLASLDAARSQMALDGHEQLTRAIRLAHLARESICQMNGLWCYGKDLIGLGGIFAFDPTKLVIRVSGCGYTGFDAFRFLQEQCHLDAEFADLKHLVCSITLADNQTSIDHLLKGLSRLSNEAKHSTFQDTIGSITCPVGLPQMRLTPRDAHFVNQVRVIPLTESVGRILTESVIPYPPGVPLLVPGEIIEQRHVEYINYLISKGGDIIGVEDPLMRTIQVLGE